MYTLEEIKEAIMTLKEIVEYETKLPSDEIPWSPESMCADLEKILTGDPYMMATIHEMEKTK